MAEELCTESKTVGLTVNNYSKTKIMSNDNKNRSSAIWEIHRVFYGAYNKY